MKERRKEKGEMIKAYTDMEQSKKLAEILPLESADMSYSFDFDSGIYEISATPYKNWVVPKYAQPDDGFGQVIPCWSLAALLNVIPEGLIEKYYTPNIQKENGKYSIAYGNEELLCEADTPVDACYEMIIKLNELKML